LCPKHLQGIAAAPQITGAVVWMVTNMQLSGDADQKLELASRRTQQQQQGVSSSSAAMQEAAEVQLVSQRLTVRAVAVATGARG
jgi:hypothetical protein